jgi:hypothetical protein
MKIKFTLLACALLGCTFPVAYAADTPAAATPAPATADKGNAAAAADAVNAGDAPSYPALVVDDVKHVVTAPARWDGDDWKTVGWSTAAVLGTALAIDRPWRDEMRRHAPNNNPVLKQVERFGAQYSPLVVGGFLAAGALSGDDNTLETGEDMVTASLIASGIVTPTIKLLFGRARPRANMGVNYFRPFSSANASFPSGHTTEAFALASVAAGHYDSPWVGYTAYGLAGMVGLARTYHDAHFASDVLAGAMIGTAVGRSVVEYNRQHRGRNKVVIIPQLAPGTVGVQVAGSF